MLFATTLSFSVLLGLVSGHGEMKSPRSRNWLAHQEGTEGLVEGKAKAEYCYHCLNTNPPELGDKGVCGQSSHDYNAWVDTLGLPMEWNSQATYNAGQEIVIESYLDTHHAGHMTASICPITGDEQPTQGCFDQHKLEFVEDLLFSMPKDPNFTDRGYYAGGQGSSNHQSHKMVFKLPDNVKGEKVLLQWRYITANSCSPPGYADYFSANSQLPSNYWSSSVTLCTPPYPHDGSRSAGWPEQFWNCAEVEIVDPVPTISPAPTMAPVTSAPTVTAKPSVENTYVPPSTEACCSQNFKDCDAAWVADQASCESFGHKWLEYGALGDTCQARWTGCGFSELCCAGLTCTANQDGTWYGCELVPETNPVTPAPTNPQASAPTASPMSVPETTAPTNKPTPSPTPAADPQTSAPVTTSTGCCSQDFKECINWCGSTQESCESCGQIWLENGPPPGECKAKWIDCAHDKEGCCDGLTCVKQSEWWWQCLV